MAIASSFFDRSSPIPRTCGAGVRVRADYRGELCAPAQIPGQSAHDRTARELSQVGASVSLDDLQVGDLVFFNTRNYAFSHVGLYLGDNRFIHAPRRGRDVEITTLSRDYWQRHFNGARRLVGVLPSLIPGMFPEALASTLTTLSIGSVEAPPEETPDLPGAP